jgi:chromate reductase, NAD(P)H dehydrogenase (quinone)
MNNDKAISIIAISGSLKSTSSNTNILRVMSQLAPENVVVNIFDGLDQLPYFNPESTHEIEAVAAFRQQLKQADGVILSTPEYAFGVPGVLKNALDWVVSSGELNEKPVVAISASPLYSGGDKALASLLLTLTALGTKMDTASSLSIANIKNKMNAAGECTDDEMRNALQMLMNNLLALITAA